MTAPVLVALLGEPDVGELRDAEVEELGALTERRVRIGDQEDVVGLEVAVNDALGVRGGQRATDQAQDRRGLELGIRGRARLRVESGAPSSSSITR